MHTHDGSVPEEHENPWKEFPVARGWNNLTEKVIKVVLDYKPIV